MQKFSAMLLPDDIRGLHTAATGGLSQEDFDDHVQYAQAFLLYHTLFDARMVKAMLVYHRVTMLVSEKRR